jgi:hypothetical protein
VTATIPEFFDDRPHSLAEMVADAQSAAQPLDWAALGDGPDALAALREACNGPTVEVTPYRPFEGQPERETQVWAVVDRKTAAARLVTPAPMTDPALVDRDESTAE